MKLFFILAIIYTSVIHYASGEDCTDRYLRYFDISIDTAQTLCDGKRPNLSMYDNRDNVFGCVSSLSQCQEYRSNESVIIYLCSGARDDLTQRCIDNSCREGKTISQLVNDCKRN